jgi:hypothetical protein
VERPGREKVGVAMATDAEDSEIGVEAVEEEPDNDGVLKLTVALADERDTGLAAAGAPLSALARDPRTPSRSVAMKSLFTPRNYTK